MKFFLKKSKSLRQRNLTAEKVWNQPTHRLNIHLGNKICVKKLSFKLDFIFIYH